MITILCSGSRGDLQPYIALAIELKKSGKDVRITASKSFEDFIRSYGIEYYPIQADIESVQVDEKMIKQAQSADNPFKMLLAFQKMKKYGRYMANEFYAACEGSELIIYHPGCTIGYFAAEKLGIPAVLASPFPMHKTKDVLSVILYGRFMENTLAKAFSYTMLQGMLWMTSKDSVKSIWKERFGKLPERFAAPYERHTDAKHPAVVSCSNFVFQRPTDWNEHIHQSGYWFAQEQNEYTPSRELSDFLGTGEKPIYIGFGSVFHTDQKDRLIKLILDALARSGKRGIICGMGDIADLLKNVSACGSIPHSWLFERVAAVCHHGGAGTSAAGFRVGVPSIIIPFSNDQFAWAHRAYDLGVGSKPIPIKKLNAVKLADAIRYALSDEIVSNAKALAKNIAAENGAKDAAEVIVNCLER